MNRYWFRVSEFSGKGPFTLVGVQATSWETALDKVCGFNAIPEAQRFLCIKDCLHYPQYYFLSANVDQWQCLPDEDPTAPVEIRTTRLTHENFFSFDVKCACGNPGPRPTKGWTLHDPTCRRCRGL